MELREQLRELRLAKGLTQVQLGKMLGYRVGRYRTCAAIQGIETGATNVPYKRIPDFAKVLGVPVETLLQNYIPPKPKARHKYKCPHPEYKPTICFSCANAYAHLCLWMALKDPEDGLAAMGITDYVVGKRSGAHSVAYSIRSCPSYEAQKK